MVDEKMKNSFLPGSAIVIIFAAIFPAILAMSTGADAFQKRLAGIWDIDDKASWEFQNPSEAYTPSSVELWRDISLRFDTEEQTCFARTALGSAIIRYSVVSEEKDKATLNIGEQPFTFEFKSNDTILFCSSGSGVAGCLVMKKGSASAEAEAKRTAKAEQRLTEIVNLYTRTIASRSRDILVEDFWGFERRLSSKEHLTLYLAEIAASDGKEMGGKDAEAVGQLMETILRDEVGNSNISYGRIYTNEGKPVLFSDFDAPLSCQQVEDIKGAAKTGKAGPLALITAENKTFFECYFPVLPPKWMGEGKPPIGVLVSARLMQNVLAEALNIDFQVPSGDIYLIQFTGQSYQTIGPQGLLREVQNIDFNESHELPFTQRDSLTSTGKVYSQASPGPAINSWVLFEIKSN